MKSPLPFGISTILVTLLFIFSCQKPNDETPPETDPGDLNTPGRTIEYVTTTIAGRVVNFMDEPYPGAIVKAGSMTTITDANGNFRLNNVRVDKNAAYVTIDWNGIAHGSRTLIVNANSVYYVEIIPTGTYPEPNTINSSTGGTVTNPHVSSVEFSPNSFITRADKKPYTGPVTVGVSFSDPTHYEAFDHMPATLRGISTSNEEKGLKSYAIAFLELTGASGERLDLAPGKTARFTASIPHRFRSQAQPTIPLWRLNDTTGLWKEEGTATKQGNFYVGDINSLTSWNYAYPIDLVDFKAVFKDQSGNPVFPGSVFFVSNEDSVGTGKEVMDSTGMVTCKIPANTKLKIWTYNSCSNISIDGRDIGSFKTATDLGVITINVPVKDVVTISGTVVSCNGTPVTNGYVNIRFDMINQVVPITNGSFTCNFRRCMDGYIYSAEVRAFDLGNNRVSDRIILPIKSTTVNAGQISACYAPLKHFLSYDMNGVTTTYVAPADSIGYSLSNDVCTIWAMRRNNNNKVHFSFNVKNGKGIGDMAVNFLNIYEGPKTYTGQGALKTTIDHYNAASGEFIGTMYGNVFDASTNTSPLFGIRFNTLK
jgi:hypothetical protein